MNILEIKIKQATGGEKEERRSIMKSGMQRRK
jgi:hypothetical protein